MDSFHSCAPTASDKVCMMGCACNQGSIECTDFCTSSSGGPSGVKARAWYPYVHSPNREYYVFSDGFGFGVPSSWKKTSSTQMSYMYDWIEDPDMAAACYSGCRARNQCGVSASPSPSTSVSPSQTSSSSSSSFASQSRTSSQTPSHTPSQSQTSTSSQTSSSTPSTKKTKKQGVTDLELCPDGIRRESCPSGDDDDDDGDFMIVLIILTPVFFTCCFVLLLCRQKREDKKKASDDVELDKI